MRAYERRILRGALITTGSVVEAAKALGVTHEYFRVRALHLGGVFKNHPEHEPPGPQAEARRKMKDTSLDQAVPDA